MEPQRNQQTTDDGRASHKSRDHMLMGDGWVPPVDKNVIELAFDQKLPPKLSKDPFRSFYLLSLSLFSLT